MSKSADNQVLPAIVKDNGEPVPKCTDRKCEYCGFTYKDEKCLAFKKFYGNSFDEEPEEE